MLHTREGPGRIQFSACKNRFYIFLSTKYSENCDFKSQFQDWILRTIQRESSTCQQSACQSQLLHSPLNPQIPPPPCVSCGPSDVMPGLTFSLLSVAPNIAPHQAVRPRTKDLTLYEEYNIRRNELRQRNLNRRRELEKTLPQHVLADMVSQTIVYS